MRAIHVLAAAATTALTLTACAGPYDTYYSSRYYRSPYGYYYGPQYAYQPAYQPSYYSYTPQYGYYSSSVGPGVTFAATF